MARTVKKSYHVIHRSTGNWSVKKTGAKRATGIFATKSAAVKTAKNLVTKSGGGELIVHEKDGRVSRRRSFASDSTPQRDSCIGNNSRAPKNQSEMTK